MVVQQAGSVRAAGLNEVAEDAAKSISRQLLPRMSTASETRTYTLAERLLFTEMRKIARRAAMIGFIAGYKYAIALKGREPTIPYKVKVIFGSE